MKKITLFVALVAAMTLSAEEPEWVSKIEIAGQQITSLNCQKLHELLNATPIDDAKDMAVTFDREKSVLLFRNVEIKWHEVQDRPFLKVEEKLTIVAEGDNNVEMKDAKYFLYAKSDVTIQSENVAENKLNTHGLSWEQKIGDTTPKSGIYAFLDGNVNLTISNVLNSANDYEQGIVGTKDATNKVTFDKASFFMSLSKEATVEINEMKFVGCEINAPSGAVYSPELKGIAKDGQLVVGGTVRIRPISEAIEDVISQKSDSQKILHDGQLYILRNGEVYNATGARVE